MNKLHLHPLTNVDELAWPQQQETLSLESPALLFFTDFSLSVPLVMESGVTAIEAREMMIKTHVRMKLVVDQSNRFLGVITAEDLSEQRIIQRTVGTHLQRSDLMVRDLMTPKVELVALGLNEVSQVSIANVIDLLKDNHKQHCLVMDDDGHRIRGIFSASDISRKLKLPINIQSASSFYRVFSALG